jgi:hypothetical protein
MKPKESDERRRRSYLANLSMRMLMKRILFLLLALTTIDSVVAFTAPTSRPVTAQESAPIYGIKMPAGYRDCALISVVRVGGTLNDLRAKLGNDVAIKAYREGKLLFPDGTITARVAWKQVTSEENNKAVRPIVERGLGNAVAESQSFVAGPATNVQFMVKDSKKYAATGGWSFAQFTNGKPDGEAVHKTCFSAMSRPKIATLSSPVTQLNTEHGDALWEE